MSFTHFKKTLSSSRCINREGLTIVGGDPGGTSYEIPPRLPFVDKLWDTPQDGKPGDSGDDGEGDDTYFEGGDVPGGGGDEPEFMGISNTAMATHTVSISPNPAKTALKISFTPESTDLSTSFVVLDITGKICLSVKNVQLQNKEALLDISKLTSGIYFVKIQTKDSNQIVKFVKE